MKLSPAIRCEQCGDEDVVAIAPGSEPVRVDVIDTTIQRGAPTRAWCFAHRHYAWGPPQAALYFDDVPTSDTQEDSDMPTVREAFFDAARRRFLEHVQAMLADPEMPEHQKRSEIEATHSAIAQLAALIFGRVTVIERPASEGAPRDV
jgi:hypothetical protein